MTAQPQTLRPRQQMPSPRFWTEIDWAEWRRRQRPKKRSSNTGPITYKTAHKRVGAARGHPSAYRCVNCSEPAAEWAYDGKDPAQLFGPQSTGSSSWCFYSADPAFYESMCRSCHSRKDRKAAARELQEYRLWRHTTGLTLADLKEPHG